MYPPEYKNAATINRLSGYPMYIYIYIYIYLQTRFYWITNVFSLRKRALKGGTVLIALLRSQIRLTKKSKL